LATVIAMSNATTPSNLLAKMTANSLRLPGCRHRSFNFSNIESLLITSYVIAKGDLVWAQLE
jgi:hypothetical protein